MTIAGQRRVEPVVYPSTDHMGEHEIQRLITNLLQSLLERLFAERGVRAHAGANTFIYWVEGDPKTTIAPDLYVLPGVGAERVEPSWKLWELGGVKPSFALEVASTDWKKDYEEAPGLYAAMGCEELVIFDPYATERSRKRVRWQHYKRDARGAFRKTPVRAADRVRVGSLDLWLREVRDELGRVRLRVALDDLGNELMPTEHEARIREEQARVREEQARVREEQARVREEQARRAVEEENARLRAELAALREAAKRGAR